MMRTPASTPGARGGSRPHRTWSSTHQSPTALGWGPARRLTRRRRSYIRRRPWPRPCPPQRPAREAATRAPRWQPVLFATRRASATTVVSSPIYSYRPPPLCPSKGCRSSHQGGFGHLWSLDGQRVSSTFQCAGELLFDHPHVAGDSSFGVLQVCRRFSDNVRRSRSRSRTRSRSRSRSQSHRHSQRM